MPRLPAEKIEQGSSLTKSGRAEGIVRIAPHRSATFVIMQDAAGAFVDLHFAELRRGFRPVYSPLRTGPQVAFVRAIPGFDAKLDR